ncbi:hypothetical protein EJ05DRAFT_481230 [Pseudovirgaria hyperparasitica]|uniref:Uncharacterized protein n=1 Tax=Pseudovirgaria hyperparasitica TaxID=470096 RepID=A0A6A6VQT9_9PEZI|nr:uncharacterized protein EJ05DRAFT_481230 [Pseudovirgaria hyperparasitica]KAF2752495.1 hypothetical protein EJ05DRAFT_481230 [Pseudovirgaria hyperparasitica]
MGPVALRHTGTRRGRRSSKDNDEGLEGRFRAMAVSVLKKCTAEELPQQEWKSGRHLKQIDTALPGAHVKLRSFLKKIAIEESDQCECSQGREDTRHFLLHCRRHEHLRGDVIKEGQGRYGDLSYMLGGISPYLNPDGSSPDLFTRAVCNLRLLKSGLPCVKFILGGLLVVAQSVGQQIPSEAQGTFDGVEEACRLESKDIAVSFRAPTLVELLAISESENLDMVGEVENMGSELGCMLSLYKSVSLKGRDGAK